MPIKKVAVAGDCRAEPVWSGSTQDNQTRFIAVSVPLPNNSTRSGFTLTELLLVMAVIAALVSLAVPAWGAITRSQTSSAAVSLVMGTLEQARLAAVSGKKEVWVLFKNDDTRKQASLRIVTREGIGGTVSVPFTSVGSWTMLPRGITFQTGENTLMDQKPMVEVIAAAMGAPIPPGISLGGVMFQRSGRIGLPQQGGPALLLCLQSIKGPLPTPIQLSRGSGRASYSSTSPKP